MRRGPAARAGGEPADRGRRDRRSCHQHRAVADARPHHRACDGLAALIAGKALDRSARAMAGMVSARVVRTPFVDDRRAWPHEHARCDLAATASARARIGLKGPRAADLLEQLGLAIPARPNSWAPLREQDRERFMECRRPPRIHRVLHRRARRGAGHRRRSRQLARGGPGAYPVLREDRALVLGGDRARRCAGADVQRDFAALDLAQRPSS